MNLWKAFIGDSEFILPLFHAKAAKANHAKAAKKALRATLCSTWCDFVDESEPQSITKGTHKGTQRTIVHPGEAEKVLARIWGKLGKQQDNLIQCQSFET